MYLCNVYIKDLLWLWINFVMVSFLINFLFTQGLVAASSSLMGKHLPRWPGIISFFSQLYLQLHRPQECNLQDGLLPEWKRHTYWELLRRWKSLFLGSGWGKQDWLGKSGAFLWGSYLTFWSANHWDVTKILLGWKRQFFSGNKASHPLLFPAPTND